MKGLATLVVLAAIAGPTHRPAPSIDCAHPVTARQGVGLARAVWSPHRWQRSRPRAAAIRAHRRQVQCAAGPGHRAAIKRQWRRSRAAFYEHRQFMLAWRAATPYYGCTVLGGCKLWALPSYIVDCESGGDYTPDAGLTFGGAYGLLVSTWLQFGGGAWASQANYAPPYAQDIVAHRVWTAVGPSGWACA